MRADRQSESKDVNVSNAVSTGAKGRRNIGSRLRTSKQTLELTFQGTRIQCLNRATIINSVNLTSQVYS